MQTYIYTAGDKMIEIEREFLIEIREYVVDVLNSEINKNDSRRAEISQRDLAKIDEILNHD